MSARAGAVVLAVAAAVLLATAPVAGAARVNWNEKAKYAGKPIMSYRVVSITFTKQGWRALVSFRNLSKRPIKVGNRFAIGYWTNPKSYSYAQALGFAPVTRFSSKVPSVLKPGDHWSGTISGTGVPSGTGTVYARIIFGPFTGFPGRTQAVSWITDHSQRLDSSGSGTKPKPKTTTVPGPVI
jgi:hypothetical protein